MDGRRSVPAGAALTAILTFAAVQVLLVVLAPQVLSDPDVLWHVTIGREVLGTGTLPAVDTYSWTMQGSAWIAKEWLSQVLLAAAHELGGWAGVVVLVSTSAAAAFAGLGGFLARRLPRLPVVLLLGGAFVLAAPHLNARPHVLALPLLVLWTAQVVAAADRGTAPPWWLLAVMVVWVNMHGSFLVGLVVVTAMAVDAGVSASTPARRALARRWAAFTALAMAATLATPYGWGIVRAALRVLALGEGLTVIIEWRPQDFSSFGPFELVLLVAVAGVLVTGFRLTWPRVVLLLALLHLALAAVRNGDVLGLVAPLVLAAPLARHLDPAAGPPGGGTGSRWRAASGAGAATLVVAGSAALLPGAADLAPAPSLRPVAAAEALAAAGVQRVLNDYSYGAYLMSTGTPTFIDGRTELFGAALVLRHDRALRLSPPEEFEELVVHWDVDGTLLPVGTPALAHLDASAVWERVHEDGLAVVHRRVED